MPAAVNVLKCSEVLRPKKEKNYLYQCHVSEGWPVTNSLGIIRRHEEGFENEILYFLMESVMTILKHGQKTSINSKEVGSSGEEQTVETSSVALKIN